MPVMKLIALHMLVMDLMSLQELAIKLTVIYVHYLIQLVKPHCALPAVRGYLATSSM